MSDAPPTSTPTRPPARPAPRVLRGLALPLGAPPQDLVPLAAQALGVSVGDIAEVRPRKVSLDARAKRPKRVYTIEVWLVGEDVPPDTPPAPRLPARVRPLVPGRAPIIVGTGPAGLWAALRLLEAGEPSILLERGARMDRRHRAVVGLRRRGRLDPETNLCFGEGGAGTYSDGKLYTRKRHPLVRRVYEDLVAFGAPPAVLTDAHPHVGTNRIIRVVEAIRRFLVDHGCEVRFDARVDGLVRDARGAVAGVRLADGQEVAGSSVILATGHSARDTYAWLHAAGVPLVAKPFAVGARVEHPQGLIDRIQYGPHAGHPALGAAAYSLKTQVAGRGVYSFCMCPGGFVIPTPTEPGHLNVNGMSSSTRGSRWANSALVVTVEPADFWLARPGDLAAHGPLAGLELQRALERAAFTAGGGDYHAPAQRLTDFLQGRVGDLPARTSFHPGVRPADLKAVLPTRLTGPLGRAVLGFERKMAGFLTREAVLMGVETTTSSPVRVARDGEGLSPEGFDGLFPAGEGGGYAGGIVSSAIDGLRVAQAALARVPPLR